MKMITSGSSELNELLAHMNDEGGFPISVLTDVQGFAIASAASPGTDPERQSAVVALVQKTALQAGKQLGLGDADEISIFDTNGQRLVCRPFKAKSHDLILAVTVPDSQTSYRRLTNQVITAIRRIWNRQSE